jgi:MFS family permease
VEDLCVAQPDLLGTNRFFRSRDIVCNLHLCFIAQFGGAIGGLAYSDTIADVIPRSRAVEVFGRVNAYTLSSSVAGLSIATAIFLFLNVREAYRVIYVISLITAAISAGILYLVTDLVRRESIKLSLKQFYKKPQASLATQQ